MESDSARGREDPMKHLSIVSLVTSIGFLLAAPAAAHTYPFGWRIYKDIALNC